MAALPSYVIVRMSGYSETFDPSVQSTEMERGPNKESVLNSQVKMRLGVSFLFMTSDDAESFLDWYFDTIGRIGYFTMTHPRTGATISAKFPKGDLGELRSAAGTNHMCQRDLTVEYLR